MQCLSNFVSFVGHSKGPIAILQDCVRRVRAYSRISYLTIRQLCLATGTDCQARPYDHERARTSSIQVVLLVLVPAHKDVLHQAGPVVYHSHTSGVECAQAEDLPQHDSAYHAALRINYLDYFIVFCPHKLSR